MFEQTLNSKLFNGVQKVHVQGIQQFDDFMLIWNIESW